MTFEITLAVIDGLSTGHLILLVLALVIVFGFEFVNGFHDTANAVATVIYTNSMRPWSAVIWSGICNFLGVYFGGIAVAYAIVHLLPVDLLVNINTHAGLAMVFALLVSSIVWNIGTWYFALPASSSHALIGSILGVGLAHGLMIGKPFGAGVNWGKAQEVGLALIISPLIGFGLAALLLLAAKRLIKNPALYEAPAPNVPPPGWIRGILIFTCTGVSFAHGSNDGQKGVGMVMLILIGLMPAHYALNAKYDAEHVRSLNATTTELQRFLEAADDPSESALKDASTIRRLLKDQSTLASIPEKQRWELRTAILNLSTAVKEAEVARGNAKSLSPDERQRVAKLRQELVEPTEYAPGWVMLAVALSLGVGTMIGWKRIVVTIGEKIGKSHLTYGQGACAELIAMGTIGLADIVGFPVSTTHVLSSAVAGTMAANRSGVQLDSIKKIALAWILTLPVTMLLSAILLWFFGFWIPAETQ